MPEGRRERGLLDTSVVVDLDRIDVSELPVEIAVAALTLAELAAGPHATDDADERARRQERLQRVEATFDALPFDENAARAYGRVFAAAPAAGRRSRRRVVDLLIAATALAAGLPLYTRNPGAFTGLEHLLDIVPVSLVETRRSPAPRPDERR